MIHDAAIRQCLQIDFITPKGVCLRGLWFGRKKAARTIIFVHGMMSSAFSMLAFVDELVNSNTSVLSFNNRGVETIADLECFTNRRKRSGWITAGTAHETFEECVDDIQGAIGIALKHGGKNIYLMGHSTGCQKSIYFSHLAASNISGIILLAPISDFAAETKRQGIRAMDRARRIARRLVRNGRPNQLLPPGTWYEILDAQRFLSLYDPDGLEEIFCYSQPNKSPKILQSISIPILVLIPAKDEYLDRPAKRLANWFEKAIKSPHRTEVVPNAPHDFQGKERSAVRIIRNFL